MFQTVPLSIIRSFSLYTQQWCMSHRFSGSLQAGSGCTSWFCSQAVNKTVWHKPFLCVQWKPPDDGQRNSPKHVEFFSKNKFEKLVHLVGFITRIRYISTDVWNSSSPSNDYWKHIQLTGISLGLVVMPSVKYCGMPNTSRYAAVSRLILLVSFIYHLIKKKKDPYNLLIIFKSVLNCHLRTNFRSHSQPHNLTLPMCWCYW